MAFPLAAPYPGYPVALGCRGTPITHHRIVPISLALDFVSSVSGYRGLWALNAPARLLVLSGLVLLRRRWSYRGPRASGARERPRTPRFYSRRAGRGQRRGSVPNSRRPSRDLRAGEILLLERRGLDRPRAERRAQGHRPYRPRPARHATDLPAVAETLRRPVRATSCGLYSQPWRRNVRNSVTHTVTMTVRTTKYPYSVFSSGMFWKFMP